jgi:hypothetical protein
MKKIISLFLFVYISFHIPSTYAQFDMMGESDFQTKPINEIKGNNTIPGTISFQPFVTITTGSEPEVIAIGDINNDGLDDVVIGTQSHSSHPWDYSILVFTQNVSGELDPPRVYWAGYITGIDIGDVNNDGLNDIVVAIGDSIGVFYQNPDGSLSAKKSYYSIHVPNHIALDNVGSVKIGDINSDGKNEVIATHKWAENFRIFYQGVTGALDSSVLIDYEKGGHNEICIDDINSDGLDDLIIMGQSGPSVPLLAVFSQTEDGSLAPPTYYYYDLAPGSNGISVGDINSNSRMDVVQATGFGIINVMVWYQDSNGYLINPPIRFESYYSSTSPQVADFDLDGRADIVVAHGGWNSISVLQQNEFCQLNDRVRFDIPYASHYSIQGLSVGDLNNDGKPDIAIADYNNGLIILYNNSITTTVADHATPYNGYKLHQNFPNPFNPTTMIRYSVPVESFVTIKVFDILGKEVITLENREKSPGAYEIDFNGEELTSGMYYYRMQAGDYINTKKFILLR